MAIKRYFADSDNTITDALLEGLSNRATGSNSGQADVLEVFSIYGQSGSTEKDYSSEVSRVLLKFPVSQISKDRENNIIEESGSVSFYLKLYNARHANTLPRNYRMTIDAVSSEWEEGNGLDLDKYTDLTYDKIGSNWIRRKGPTAWSIPGGDYYNDPSSSFECAFPIGNEDLEIDITTLAEQWINSSGNEPVLGSKDNYGVMIKLSASYEASSSTNLEGANTSYYTKMFYGRGSEFFFNRPVLEARWDSSKRDNRANFYISSSLVPAEDNLNTLYMYNYIRGTLKDIGGLSTHEPVLRLYHSSGSNPEGTAKGFLNSSNSPVYFLSSSRESKGVYKVKFAVTSSIVSSTYPYLIDVWSLHEDQIHTGSAIDPKTFTMSNYNPNGKYVVSIPNLKTSYRRGQTERFRFYVREKNWSPNIYTKAKSTPEGLMINSASYEIYRVVDNKIVIPYNTGSDSGTIMSYDEQGNYFDLDINMLEEGYSYGIRVSFYEDSLTSFREHPNIFKFRVGQNEY
jgi:hypothetical protein